MKYVSIQSCGDRVADEVRTRGLILGSIARALREKYGDEALDVMKSALREAGRVSGQATAEALRKNDLSAVETLITDEIWQRILKPKIVEKSKNRIVINYHRCPVPSLEEAFASLGSSAGVMETTCMLLETYDVSVFQGINPRFVVRGPPDTGNMGLVCGGGYCTVEISLTQ